MMKLLPIPVPLKKTSPIKPILKSLSPEQILPNEPTVSDEFRPHFSGIYSVTSSDILPDNDDKQIISLLEEALSQPLSVDPNTVKKDSNSLEADVTLGDPKSSKNKYHVNLVHYDDPEKSLFASSYPESCNAFRVTRSDSDKLNVQWNFTYIGDNKSDIFSYDDEEQNIHIPSNHPTVLEKAYELKDALKEALLKLWPTQLELPLTS